MSLDKTAYYNLEQRFRSQVEKDRVHAIRVVQESGVYLPCVEPETQVDYIFVGMEPSFVWANSIEDADKKIAKGFRNFRFDGSRRHPLALLMLSIKRFLCQPERPTT